jgi:uncharacterized protein
VTGALKEGIKGLEHKLGFFAQGGKGMTSRKTPIEIVTRCESLSLDAQPLGYASRMAAKVDSAAVAGRLSALSPRVLLYRAGHWAVVQQGMSDASRSACRYHWLSQSLESFVYEPHEASCSNVRGTATRQKKGRRESRPFEGSHRERKPALYLMNSISR